MPTREQVKPIVEGKLMAVAHVHQRPPETALLFEDLGMGPTVRRAMALPYSRISSTFGGSPVSQADAGALRTVKESIDLVLQRSNARSK